MRQEERQLLIHRYADGPDQLELTLAKVPVAARTWRPGAGKWTVHEVIVHCADSEANAHLRIRYLIGELDPLIVGYDQDRWSTVLSYHEHPLEPALATVRAVRANTVPLLRRLTEEQWHKAGRHTEHSSSYGAEKWLQIYAEHLDIHVRQIERNLGAWGNR